jgi:uncharacterized protein
MKCPRCSTLLKAEEYDGVQIEVCPDCKGEWLQAGELEKIAEHHEEEFTESEIASLDGVNKEIFTKTETEHDELHCPECEDVEMKHFNYGDTSGLILDKCPDCGGIWTDRGQLEKVEELVDGWKSYLEQDTEKYGSILDKVAAKEEADLDKSVSISRFGFVNAILRQFFG